MFGYITMTQAGAADALLFDLAARLRARGLRLAGAVQRNVDRDPARRCDMDLHVLAAGAVVRISQNLGTQARGCRLDAAGLEQAVGLVGAALGSGPDDVPDSGPDLLLVNKFGKQEVDGRGFRPLIAQALLQDIPVLTAVSSGNLAGFLAFADDMADSVPATPEAVEAWCLRAVGRSLHEA